MEESRLTRQPYHPADWLCTVVYLVDMAEHSPVFVRDAAYCNPLDLTHSGASDRWALFAQAVVPKSHRFEPFEAAREGLGEEYTEQGVWGPAGTCVAYDTAVYHARLDPLDGGRDDGGRRSMHQWWARGPVEALGRPAAPPLSDRARIPQRLAEHADPATRRFYSLWDDRQREWAARGFPPLRRVDPMDDVDRGGNTTYEIDE